jgi:hypothetical protein
MWILVIMSLSTGNLEAIASANDLTTCVGGARSELRIATPAYAVSRAWCVPKAQWDSAKGGGLTDDNEIKVAP